MRIVCAYGMDGIWHCADEDEGLEVYGTETYPCVQPSFPSNI